MRHVARFSLAFILLIVIADRSVIYADDSVRLMVGRSTVVTTTVPIARVSLTSADIADALVTAPTELLINGKTPGTISMFVWDRSGGIQKYEVIVQRDIARLAEQLKRVFPAETIDVQANGRSILLTGTVTSKDVMERASELAGGFVDKKEEIISLMRLQEGAPTNQVLLRVRFAEVSRSALTELGASFFTSPLGVKNNIARVTTEQFPSVGFDDLKYTKADINKFGSDVTSASGKFSFTDFLNFFLFNEKYDLGMMVRALQSRGLFESLAEPNLVAESGKEASFLAGGEFPVPIAQGGANGLAISVTFKEFGIRLNFTPVVTGNRVHLKVRPEVSTLDFNNAIVLQGFRIPALSTRRTETELELQNGQTFAIAGLLNNTMNKQLQKVPGIGDIPILGLLFKSQAAQKQRTELVVMITPEILRTTSGGVTRELPRLQEPFLPPLEQKKSIPPPQAVFPSTPAMQGAPAPASATQGAPAPAPASPANGAAAAAEKVKALLPSTTPAAVHNETMPKANQAPADPAVRPMTEPVSKPKTDTKAVEKARKGEHSRSEAAKAAEGRTRVKQLEEQKKQQEKAAREQAKQEAEATKATAEAAKQQAAADKAADEAAAKRAAEQAKKQAELDKKQAEFDKKQAEVDKKNQKTVAEAEAKLKAAQAAYDAEVAKTKKPQPQDRQ